MAEVYVSTDVESDGPLPGVNSLLAFGSVAYTRDGKELSSFGANLELTPGAVADPATMKWWGTQVHAWDAIRRDLVPPAEAMKKYALWVAGLPGKPVFVGAPAGYDFLFVYWYLMRFNGISPFSFSAVDMKTAAMMVLNTEYRESSKRNMPRSWFNPALKHTHIPIDDAREQGFTFCKILRANDALHRNAKESMDPLLKFP